MKPAARVGLCISAVALLVAADAAAATSSGPAPRRWRNEEGRSGIEGTTMLRLHGGLSSPTGNFGDAFDGGLGIGVDIAHGIGRATFLTGGVAFHSFDGDGFPGDAQVVPITFSVGTFLPSSSRVRPWISGGIGAYNVDIDFGTFVDPFVRPLAGSASETNFGFNFGAGFGTPAGERGAWGAGIKFHHIFEGDVFNDLDFLTVQIGYGFYL